MRKRVPWFDRDAVKEIYSFAEWFRSKGVNAEVDHVIPLRGATFSGLHVQNNLRVDTFDANRKKSNRLPPDA